MALVPFAEKKLIPPGSSDPRITPRIGILHVDAGNTYDLYDFFKDRSGGIESHGHIPKDGKIFQYRDTDWQADANYHANDFATSWETQGFGAGEWTDEQIESIKRLMIWHWHEHKIPLRVVTSWNDPKGGWGYHTLFGSPSMWTPVAKSCPGPDRIRQFHEILVPWMKTNPHLEDEVTPQDIDKVSDAVVAKLKPVIKDVVKEQVAFQFRDLFPKRDLDLGVRAAIKQLVQDAAAENRAEAKADQA